MIEYRALADKGSLALSIYLPIMSNPVYAKPGRSQDNVRENLSATGRNFGFTSQDDR